MSVEAINTFQESGLREKLSRFGGRLAGGLSLGLRAEFTRYGLARDLAVPIKRPSAKIKISVRPIEPRDVTPLFVPTGEGDTPLERREAALRLAFVEKKVGRGFVAVDERNGAPCYAQWLFGVADNDFIASLKGFLPLRENQALLENAYTPPAYRGFGIMSEAMALIAEQAPQVNAREVLTYVGIENIASLKGCQRAGFNPAILHRCVRYGFGLMRRDDFEVLPHDDPRRTAKF